MWKTGIFKLTCLGGGHYKNVDQKGGTPSKLLGDPQRVKPPVLTCVAQDDLLSELNPLPMLLSFLCCKGLVDFHETITFASIGNNTELHLGPTVLPPERGHNTDGAILLFLDFISVLPLDMGIQENKSPVG